MSTFDYMFRILDYDTSIFEGYWYSHFFDTIDIWGMQPLLHIYISCPTSTHPRFFQSICHIYKSIIHVKNRKCCIPLYSQYENTILILYNSIFFFGKFNYLGYLHNNVSKLFNYSNAIWILILVDQMKIKTQKMNKLISKLFMYIFMYFSSWFGIDQLLFYTNLYNKRISQKSVKWQSREN